MVLAGDSPLSLLLADDDIIFCQVLSRALDKRGYTVTVAHSVEQAVPLARQLHPRYAVVDLKMGGASGLVLVEALHRMNPAMRIVVLTGYASIATAVAAIKLGATQYLTKPANADEIVAAFGHTGAGVACSSVEIKPLGRLESEYIQKIMLEHDNNITLAARALNMHRKTLQRKLSRFKAG